VDFEESFSENFMILKLFSASDWSKRGEEGSLDSGRRPKKALKAAESVSIAT
jgi:hypothetical protein